jgi:hypothetical protein
MAAVVVQPRIVIPRPLTASPMIARLPVMRMIRNINGGVEKPCTIPAKTKALIGLNPKKFIHMAITVKPAMRR